ncbi:MAG: hypothetical protein Harvfovirus52_3 [Harvfovirus sp.]|uniref:Uncharacterized protein n=1 Tax=Harvfovirus sp. TaxID=2487768 RepID=A0A3G5A384_9VIRU|nr:MAG: hypothetical protein Harvfovirus52_3 [Harvfovirus sp.]
MASFEKKGTHLMIPKWELQALTIQHKFLQRQIAALSLLVSSPIVDRPLYDGMLDLIKNGFLGMFIGGNLAVHFQRFRCPATLQEIMGLGAANILMQQTTLMEVRTQRHELKQKAFQEDMQKLLHLRDMIRIRFEPIDDSLKEGFCDRKLVFRSGDRCRGIFNPRRGVTLSTFSLGMEKELMKLFLPCTASKYFEVCPTLRQNSRKNCAVLLMPSEAITRGCQAHICVRSKKTFSVIEVKNDILTCIRTFDVERIGDDEITVGMVSISDRHMFLALLEEDNIHTLFIDVLNGLEVEKSPHNMGSDLERSLATHRLWRLYPLEFRLIPFTPIEKAENEGQLSKILITFPAVLVNLCMLFLM